MNPTTNTSSNNHPSMNHRENALETVMGKMRKKLSESQMENCSSFLRINQPATSPTPLRLNHENSLRPLKQRLDALKRNFIANQRNNLRTISPNIYSNRQQNIAHISKESKLSTRPPSTTNEIQTSETTSTDIVEARRRLHKEREEMENLKRQKEEFEALKKEWEDSNVCSICYEKLDGRIIRLHPCGHTFCQTCSNNLQICPKCRQTIEDRQITFLS